MLVEHPPRAGLEGAALSTKTGETRTAGVSAANDEDRSEPIESRAQGLPRSSQPLSQRIQS